MSEAERVALLRRELASERLLASPYASYSAETLSELAIVRAAAEAHRRYGRACITTYIISKCESVSDLLEVNILLKEAGLYRGHGDAARRDHGRAAVRDHRRSGEIAAGDARLVRVAGNRGHHLGASASRK